MDFNLPAHATRKPDKACILYVSLGDGVQARVKIQVQREPEFPTPNEPMALSAPSPRELHSTALALATGTFRFSSHF